MALRSMCIAAVCLGLSSAAACAGEQSGIFHRVSCSVVRYYVAKYSESMAEQWARAKGASEAEIEAARHCLGSESARTVRTARARPLALGSYGW
jgi:ABC-type sulfate transport system substrate-binding protein